MKRFAVSFISMHDNVLTTEIVEADTWQNAIVKHSKVDGYDFNFGTLEEAKATAFDQDAMIDCIEIPDAPC